MAQFRVPYPSDPQQRQALFDKVAARAARHGTYDGTPTEGSFEGKTPIGAFAGTYRVLEASGELEVELTRKPWIVSTQLIEHEVRKFLARI